MRGILLSAGFLLCLVLISQTAVYGVQEKAWDPTPADGAVLVDPDTDLQWKSGMDPENETEPNPNIVMHLVYMNSVSDPNLVLVGEVEPGDPVAESASFEPGTLVRGGIYLWRIDEDLAGDANTITGDVWTFDVVPTTPVFDASYPQNVYLDAGETAIFMVSAMNPYTFDSTNLTYQWYKAPGTMLSDDTKYGGTTTDTLSVGDVQAGESGDEYFCTVTVIESGDSGDSDTAKLVIKELVGYWKFDGDADDSSGYGNHGTVNGAIFTGGIDGQALLFDGMNDYVDVPGTAFDALDPGVLTISVWAYGGLPLPVNNSIFEAEDVDGNRVVNCHLAWARDNSIYWDAGDATGIDRIVQEADAEDYKGSWNHYAFTKDADTGQMNIFINGEPWFSGTGLTRTLGTVETFVIGSGWTTSSSSIADPFPGMIDEFRIYNYPMTVIEAAYIYYALSGESACAVPVPNDITGDCEVNMDDLALLVGEYLACNWVPAEICP